MLSVFKREWKACMQNLYGLVFMAVLLFATGGLIYYYNIREQIPDVHLSGIEDALYRALYVLIPGIPFLCMRSMAEDRKNRTDLIYRALPIKPSAVVLGKFFALVAVFAIPVAVMAVYPFLLGMFGTVRYAQSYLLILLFFLIGVALIALCQFISGLCTKVWLAFGAGLVATAAVCLLPFLCRLLPDGRFATILASISPFRHFDELARYGVFRWQSVAVLLLYAALFVFLTLLVRGGRRLRTALVGAPVLCVVIAAAVLPPFLPTAATEFDTDKPTYTALSGQTKKFLEDLDEDVTFRWICKDGKVDSTVVGDWFPRLLERYENASDHIKVERITDDEDIEFYLDEIGLYNHDLIISSEKRLTVIGSESLFTYSNAHINEAMGGELELTWEEMLEYVQYIYSQTGGQTDISSSVYPHSCVADSVLLSAVDYVTTDEVPQAYILTGFGGSPLPDRLKETLEDYGYGAGFEELDISRAEAIPDNTGCVILHAPVADLGDRETALLSDYLSHGGSLVLTTSPNTWAKECPNLQSLLTPFGLKALPGIVFETNAKYYASSTDTLVPQVNPNHTLYQIYQENPSHRMPWSHAIGVSDGVSAAAVFATSSAAIRKPAGGTSEILGEPTQYCVAVSADRQVTTPSGASATSNILWFGSTDAFTDAVATTATANYNYMAMGVSAICGDYSSPYKTSVPRVRVTVDLLDELGDGMSVLLTLVLVVIIPIATLAVGVAIWVSRRRRS